MGLKEELRLPNKVSTKAHEAMLNIFVTSARLSKVGDRILRPMGITIAQFNVLMMLDHQTESGSIDQSSLGRMLVVNRSNMTGLVDRMEKARMVKRVPDPLDRRVKIVQITDKGRELLNKTIPVYRKTVQAAVSGLSAEDQKSLCRILETVRGSLEKRTNSRG